MLYVEQIEKMKNTEKRIQRLLEILKYFFDIFRKSHCSRKLITSLGQFGCFLSEYNLDYEHNRNKHQEISANDFFFSFLIKSFLFPMGKSLPNIQSWHNFIGNLLYYCCSLNLKGILSLWPCLSNFWWQASYDKLQPKEIYPIFPTSLIRLKKFILLHHQLRFGCLWERQKIRNKTRPCKCLNSLLLFLFFFFLMNEEQGVHQQL